MIIGYGVCGKEADRYLRATLEEFKRLCDQTVICGNNITDAERNMIAEYGFILVEDNREWGTSQHLIKQDLMKEVAKLKPEYCVCLDMDEVFDPTLTKTRLIEAFKTGHALYFYIVNLWNEGWNKQWSFWNIRAWKWSNDLKFENKPLHCGLAPAWCYRYGSYTSYFVKHYGLMKATDRQKKVERYEKYDPEAKYKDKSYYEALKSSDFVPLDENEIRRELTKEIGVQKMRKIVEIQNVYYYVRSKDGRVIDIPAKDLDDTLKRGFTLISKVGETVDKKKSYRIAYIGRFERIWDEEYIALSFEELGHTITRIDERLPVNEILKKILENHVDFVLFAKLNVSKSGALLNEIKRHGIKTVCWIFDLYWGYVREHKIDLLPCFLADLVITTDGGNDSKWKTRQINHRVVRQGIFKPECYMLSNPKEYDVLFVGSLNHANTERNIIIRQVAEDFNFTWIGKDERQEVRSNDLNVLLSKAKVIIGDSVPSDFYWSNRIVETLGRGGFLIHKDVRGLKEEYPYLVTYTDYADLKQKINYYLTHDKEREEIVKKNFEWVRDNYTCEKKCQELLKHFEDQ